MTKYQYITLREKPDLMVTAAEWFHSKWGVPTEAYLECMDSYLGGETEYGWYLCLDGEKIIGGLGVIECLRTDRMEVNFSGKWRKAPDMWLGLYPGVMRGGVHALAPGHHI